MKKIVITLAILTSLVACKKKSIEPTPTTPVNPVRVDSLYRELAIAISGDSAEVSVDGIITNKMFLLVGSYQYFRFYKGETISIRVKSFANYCQVSEYYIINGSYGGPVVSSCNCPEYTHSFVVR